MKKSLFIFLIGILFLGCGESDQQPLEKADRLTKQAFEEMNRQNYDEAEHLLAESIDIHSQANNEAKLAENYSALSTVQLLSGKLSPGLESLIALRGIYQHGADRNAELQTMLQIGKIYFQLGRTEDAYSILIEAFNNSKIFHLDLISINIALHLSTIYSKSEKYERALIYATNAYELSKAQQNHSAIVEALELRMFALVALGNVSKAFELFREAESIVISDRSVNSAKFYLESGKSFAKAEEWSLAKRNYERVITLAENTQRSDLSNIVIGAKIGLAELYFHHFAFAEAYQNFVHAYNLAKDGSDWSIKSYLLVRAGDCLTKQSSYIESQDNNIRAAQLYEQAQTLFSRNSFSFGEAIALHRLGMLKELAGDDNAAITFYKRAYDKFTDNRIDPMLYSFPVCLKTLYQSESKDRSPEEWLSRNLISLLLKYKRTNEAFSYHQSVRSQLLITQVSSLVLHFKEQVKSDRYSTLQNTMIMNRRNILELQHMNMLNLQSKNRNYAYKLQQQIAYTKSKILSDAVSLSQEYPQFSFVTKTPHSSQDALLQFIPHSYIVLDYFIDNNEAWVFIARQEEELKAVKLSSYGLALQKKMKRYCDLVSTSNVHTTELQLLSNELYDFLIKPIELAGFQRTIIIPPLQIERFPFHMLRENGITLIEKIGVSYLPHLAFMSSPGNVPKFMNSISAFGFTANDRWGLEFELRDIRSFFRNTQVNINQTATKDRLESSSGEVLQISSQFTIDSDNNAWYTLSGGSTSKAGMKIPVSHFAELYPFPIVYLSDVQSFTNNISSLHPLLWLLKGSSSVVTTRFPITSNVSKTFEENFYSSLSSDMNPFLAYRRAVVGLGKKKEISGGFGGAAYMYYGVK